MQRDFFNKTVILFFVLFAGSNQYVLSQGNVKQGNPVPLNFCIKDSEMKLYHMVNEYRGRYNLPPIPLSKSLCYVAAQHAKDLMLFHPDQGSCNFHSWSNKGNWKPFCYPRDETKKASVWDKPRELTTYPSKAYEIVYWENTQIVPDSIMNVWKTEEYFNNFLLNSGKWQDQPWNAIGIAIFENYVCAWFGMAADPEGSAIVCGTKVEKPAVKDTVKPTTPPKKTVPPKKPVPPQNKPLKSDSLKPAKTDSTAHAQPGSWYIIVKTNLPMEAARKLADDLRLKGYPQAQVLEKDGKTRVSVFGSADKPTAAAKLKEVKMVYKDAWLLKE